MEPQSGIKTWQWVVTVIVIIVLIIIGIFVFSGNETVTPVDNTQNTPTDTNNTIGLNRIVMNDQYPGNVVYLSSVQLEKTGWVSIHADNAGKLGEVIGSAKFEKGIAPGKVTLTKSTVEGGTYYAVLRFDDGDGIFNATKDLPVKDSKGNDIIRLFRVTESAGEMIKG